MPTMTIIIIAVLAPLLLWTIYTLIKDLVRKLHKGSAIRGRDDDIRGTIEVEREKDRQRMGSMFASSIFRGRKSGSDGSGGDNS